MDVQVGGALEITLDLGGDLAGCRVGAANRVGGEPLGRDHAAPICYDHCGMVDPGSAQSSLNHCSRCEAIKTQQLLLNSHKSRQAASLGVSCLPLPGLDTDFPRRRHIIEARTRPRVTRGCIRDRGQHS